MLSYIGHGIVERFRLSSERDKAGEQGTSVHDLAEKYIHGLDYGIPDDKKVQKAFKKFTEWWDQQEYKIVWSEKQMVYNENYEFGGCPDLLVQDKEGNYVLIDFKTGKKEFTLIRLFSLVHTLDWINQNDNIEVQKGIIVRLPKNNSKIETKEFTIEKLTLGFDQFRLFREAYDNNAIIERCFRKKISMTTMKEALEFVNRDECNEFEKSFYDKGKDKDWQVSEKTNGCYCKNAKKISRR